MNQTQNVIKHLHQACFGAPSCAQNPVFELMSFELLPNTDNMPLMGDIPTIKGSVSSRQNCLEVTFTLTNIPTTLEVAAFDGANTRHSDYLWEQNCLEIFVGDTNTHYYEVNASVDGRFAVYEFDSYRHPASLPPQKSTDITFQWHKVQIGSELVYQFSLAFLATSKFKVQEITRINPCAILYADHHPIFYAIHHATPPDFHHKAYWVKF